MQRKPTIERYIMNHLCLIHSPAEDYRSRTLTLAGCIKTHVNLIYACKSGGVANFNKVVVDASNDMTFVANKFEDIKISRESTKRCHR